MWFFFFLPFKMSYLPQTLFSKGPAWPKTALLESNNFINCVAISQYFLFSSSMTLVRIFALDSV